MPRRVPGKKAGRKPFWVHLMLPLAAIMLGLLAWDGASAWLRSQSSQELRLYVEGDLRRIEPSLVEQLALVYLDTDLLSLDIEGIQSDIEALPWVERAMVRRHWPDGVRVRVWEHQPVAQWGADSYVTAEGVRFTPLRMAANLDLPRLDGPVGGERSLIATLTAFSSAASPLGVRVDAVWIDPRGSWHVRLADGQRLDIGRENTEQRLARFLSAVYPAVGQRLAEIEYIDLRYSNGFAVGWREPVPEEAEQMTGQNTESTGMVSPTREHRHG